MSEPKPAGIWAQAVAETGILAPETIAEVLERGLHGQFTNQRVLVLIPDHTRSVPLPQLFPLVVRALRDARQVDFLVALGTHPPLSEPALHRLVGLSAETRATEYRQIGLLNHVWDDPQTLQSIGSLEKDEIRQLAGPNWHPSLPEQINVRINRLALEYDHILILGPTFPHEVVGMSGGAKYLFPGISGPDMINATHWLGALAGVKGTIGFRDTPVRAMITAAAARLRTPVTLAGLVVEGHDLCGLFVGEVQPAWEQAAALSAQRHIRRCPRPFQRILSWAPPMYDELWTAGKAMYKLEPVLAKGGELIIYAPHLETVSHVHGRFIEMIGYHCLPWFLSDLSRFSHIPLGVLAHSTHVRGSGRMVAGVEQCDARVTLASRIPEEVCRKLNLGYLDPATIDPHAWAGREDEGVLMVPRAGEILYRLNEES